MRKQVTVSGMPVTFAGTLSPVIVRAGWRFRVVSPDQDGFYEDSYLLPKDSTWHAIAKKLLIENGSDT